MPVRRPSLRLALLSTALLSAGLAAPAHAEWLRGESEHFVVFGDVSESAMRNYVRKVERFDSVLRLYYPISNEHEAAKLEIYLAKDHDDMERIAPGIGSRIAGFYSPNAEHVYAVVDRDKSEGDKTLFHEYSHHFMLANLPGAYPAWFVEGFAEFYSTTDVTPGRLVVGTFSRGRYNTLNSPLNTWVPMRVVLGSSTRELRGNQGFGFYAQAWLLMNYLMSTPERQQMLRRYLQAMLNGEDSVTAMEAATGRSADALQSDIYSYSTLIQVSRPQVTLPEAEVTISRLPASVRDLIWLNLRMDRSLSDAERLRGDGEPDAEEAEQEDDPAEAARRAEALAEAREDFREGVALARATAARYPGDRLAAIVLAKAELADGKPDAARAALSELTGPGSTDAEALRLSAVAMLEQAGAEDTGDDAAMTLKREARGLLARSLQADPEDFRTYLALDESRWGQSGYPNDNDLNTLLAAAEYAPQVRATRYRAAQALIQAGIYQQAIDLLTPIANDPHGGRDNDRVKALINRARAATGQAPDTTEAPPSEGEDEGETAA